MIDSFSKRNIPQAPGGSIFSGRLKEFQRDPLSFMQKLSRNYGQVVRFKLGPSQKVILLSDPELIKEVLVTKQKNFIKSSDIRSLKALLGEGLLTSEKDVHMRQRRLIQPAFKKTHVASYGQDMIDVAQHYVQMWKHGMETEITEEMMNITLGVISKTMFSMDLKEGYELVGEAVEKVMKLAIKRMRRAIPLPLWLPSKSNREFKQAAKVLDAVLFNIIDQRRRGGIQKEDLLGMIMAARDDENGTGMTDKQIRDELMTIFLAGHETTANALSWTLYLLAQHPDKEAKMHAEIDSVIRGKTIRPEHFSSLKYTQNVIWESLRLFPPAYVIGREVDKTVEIGGYLFKKGETVLMSQYVMHRSPEYFEKADEFNPERFDNDLLKKLPAYAYFPFGGGPRVCIGNHFSFMEMVLVLACLASRYQFRLTTEQEKVKTQPLITLRPKPGIRMILHERETEKSNPDSV
ncbi:cytochrome P450 [Bacillus dakarensis]|uniref:cytochrome P450 n=1 Tax=Robertmurraya dakarensis TaxID=1926278 RepID=UPI001F1B3558|nr:cytochrome P450 [Bacillus dakarensis]